MVSPSQSPSRALEPGLGSPQWRASRQYIDAMWNHAPARLLRPLPGVLFALAPQEAPEVAAAPLISPDHLIEPFVAEGDPVRGPHPETALLRTPTFRP